MRVRNKELRQRRHRKEQRIKELIKEAQAGKKAAPAKSASKADGDKPKRTPAKKAATTTAKKKAAPKKKKEEQVVEPTPESAASTEPQTEPAE